MIYRGSLLRRIESALRPSDERGIVDIDSYTHRSCGLMQTFAVRYALAPACILLSVLLSLSPAGRQLSPSELIGFAVLVVAWFGGAGPGFLSAILAALALPLLGAVNQPLLGGILDLPRFVVLSAMGLAVGWWSFRRRQVEAGLRASQQRFALAVAGSYEGIWDIDFVGRSVFFSARSRELCGLPPGPEVVPLDGWFEALPLHPEDAPRRLAAVAAHLSGQTPVYKGEFRLRQLDGAYRWRHLHGVCVRDAEGKPLRMAGSISDVDARRRAEDALRESERRYEVAVNASDDGLWDWLPADDEVYASPRLREMYGFPPDLNLVGRNDLVTRIPFHPEDRAGLLQGFADHLASTNGRHTVEARILRNGETRWVQISGFAARAPSGTLLRWTGTARDITERKRSEEELRAMESRLRQAQRLEAMGTLAGGIAHHFNNILGTILGYGEMALRDAPAGSRLARDLESVMVAGERGRALVDRVLTFSRSSASTRRPVHVERVVSESLDLAAGRIPASIKIEVSLTAGRAAVSGEPTQVHQLVMNLAINAIQAMPRGGVLRVSLRVERFDVERVATIGTVAAAEYIVLEVADSGTGISPLILDRIFEPFFTTREVDGGSGLGLSLVHGIVMDVAGAIDVRSTPDSGSAFTVYLPRMGDVPETSSGDTATAPRGKGQRILVVGEGRPLRQVTEQLKHLGCQPMGFASAAEAIEGFHADPDGFDAVITDRHLSGMPDSMLIRETRRIRPTIPVVLVSGNTTQMQARWLVGEDADKAPEEPSAPQELVARLIQILRQ